MLKYELEAAFLAGIIELGFSQVNTITLERPKNLDFGDFASNIAFQLARDLKRAPVQIAVELTQRLADDSKLADHICFSAVNGFINMTLSDDYLWSRFTSLGEPVDFPEFPGQILLEFVSANPTGPLHIGHGRWAVIGSVMASLLRFVGANVHTEFYVNDAGAQVGLLRDSVSAVRDGKPVPEDGYQGDYIHELAKLDQDPVQVNMASQKAVLDRIGVGFDCWFSELSLHDKGAVEACMATLKEQSLSYEKEGALWFKAQSLGDEKDRVLIKADGRYTYFAVDIAYHHDKLCRGFSRLINIWGADHHGYVPRVRHAVMALPESSRLLEDGFTFCLGQMVSLRRDGEPVKMSKRTGEMITLDEVVTEIGSDATRYFMVEKSPDTHMDFDLSLAKTRSSENPVYYIQYAHARICSLLAKVGDIQLDESMGLSEPLIPKERALLLHCVKFYDEIWGCATQLQVHRLPQYTWQLARLFHHFYEVCPIIKASDSLQQQRILILLKTRFILRSCLSLMGISAPERM